MGGIGDGRGTNYFPARRNFRAHRHHHVHAPGTRDGAKQFLMNFSRNKFYKPMLLVLAAALFFGSSQMQRVLNRDRETLGLTRVDPLENAPPILAFTTVAL